MQKLTQQMRIALSILFLVAFILACGSFPDIPFKIQKISEQVVDLDNDGLYEGLRIEMTSNAPPRTYRWSGDLTDRAGTSIASGGGSDGVNLGQPMAFTFRGDAIRANGKSGPYTLRNVRVVDIMAANREVFSSTYAIYTTTEYASSKFVSLLPPIRKQIQVDGAIISASLPIRDQQIILNFTGKKGQEVWFAQAPFVGCSVQTPNGESGFYGSSLVSPKCGGEGMVLPTTGIYTITYIMENDAWSLSNWTWTLSSPLIQQIETDGRLLNLSLRSGQIAYLYFNAQEGQAFKILQTYSGGSASHQIFDEGNRDYLFSMESTSSSDRYPNHRELFIAPKTRSYKLIVHGVNGGAGTHEISINAISVPKLNLNSQPTALKISEPGQMAMVYFIGKKDENIEIKIAGSDVGKAKINFFTLPFEEPHEGNKFILSSDGIVQGLAPLNIDGVYVIRFMPPEKAVGEFKISISKKKSP